MEGEAEQPTIPEVVDVGTEVRKDGGSRRAEAVVYLDDSALLGHEHPAVAGEFDGRGQGEPTEDGRVLEPRWEGYPTSLASDEGRERRGEQEDPGHVADDLHGVPGQAARPAPVARCGEACVACVRSIRGAVAGGTRRARSRSRPRVSPCRGSVSRAACMLRPRLLLARVSTRIRSLLPWVLAMVGLLLAGAVAIARVVGWGPDGAGSWSLVDFRTAVYFPVVCFVTGCNPYDATEFVSRFPVKPFGLYSPLTLVLHLPFALLPLHVAEWLYVGAALLLTVVAAGLALRFATRVVPPRQALIAAALLLLSRPGHSNVVLGQSAATAAV